MSKPRICTTEWDKAFPEKWSIARGDSYTVNPWIAFPPMRQTIMPFESVHRFGSHEAAVRHLVKKGWRK